MPSSLFMAFCCVLLVGAVLVFVGREGNRRLMTIGAIIGAIGLIGALVSTFFS